MGYELNQLMKLYGVSTPSANTYSGASKPTDFADANFEQKMKNYNTDTEAYKKYQEEYGNRLGSASIYDLPQFQPKAAATTGATGTTGLTGLANQTMAQPVLTNPVYTNNPAYYKDLVMDRYKSVLNTANPDLKGLAYWSQQLASGALDPGKFDTALLEGSKVKTDTTTGTTTGTTGTDTGTNTNANTTIGGTNTNTNTNTGATTGGGLTDIAKTYTQMYGDQNLYTDQSGNQYRYDSESGQYNPYTNGGVEFSHGGSVKGYSRGGPENRQSMGDQGGLLTLADIYGLENPTDLPYIEMPVQDASAPTTVVSDEPKVTTRAQTILPEIISVREPGEGPELTPEQILKNMEGKNAVTVAQPPVPTTLTNAATTVEGAVAGGPRPTGRPSLDDLNKRYAASGIDYSGRIQAASDKVRADTEAFKALLEKSMVSEKDSAPSKAEMYFRLAAAFGAPSKTGNIFENVSMAAKELGDFSKDTTAAKRAAQARNLELMMKGQDMSMRTSKEELDRLTNLAAEDNKERRQFVKDSISEYIRSNEPQSAAGKIARDKGFVPGTQEYKDEVEAQSKLLIDKETARLNAAIAQMNATTAQMELANRKQIEAERAAKAKELNLDPKSYDEKLKMDDGIQRRESIIGALKEALAHNEIAFGGTIVEKAQRLATEQSDPKNPQVLATKQLENILGKAAVDQLKEKLGAGITDFEQKSMRALQGIDALSREERTDIILRALNDVLMQQNQQKEKLKLIMSGKYREKTED